MDGDDLWQQWAAGWKRPAPQPASLRIINPADLAAVSAPPREWIVPDWLPVGAVTSLYGDGGVGKTLLAQQLMTCTALGLPWCGLEVLPCRSVALFCEDDPDELHRRQAAICDSYGVCIGALEPMRWLSGVGEDTSLMTFEYSGVHTTFLFDAIRDAALDHGARLIVLDPAADLFAGNENDRHQVRQFISRLNRLAIDIGGAVLLTAHPSRSGLSTGNLDGGSTAWSNSVRSRWSLARVQTEADVASDVNARVLSRKKANYAAAGEEIQLRWSNGALLPQRAASSGGAPEQAAVANLFLTLLDRCMGQGQSVSHSANAPNFAPRVFSRRPDRAGYMRKDFERAMEALFAEKRIRVEEYGRPGKWRSRVARDHRNGEAAP